MSAAAARIAQYTIEATRGAERVRLDRPDPPSAFATARRLRAMGWTVVVSDPYAEPASSSRRMRVAAVSR